MPAEPDPAKRRDAYDSECGCAGKGDGQRPDNFPASICCGGVMYDGDCCVSTQASNCNDGKICTDDICNANHECENPNLADGTACGLIACHEDYCDGDEFVDFQVYDSSVKSTCSRTCFNGACYDCACGSQRIKCKQQTHQVYAPFNDLNYNCNCNCGDYDKEETGDINSGICADRKDNDCDGYTDMSDYPTRPSNTGGCCGSGPGGCNYADYAYIPGLRQYEDFYCCNFNSANPYLGDICAAGNCLDWEECDVSPITRCLSLNDLATCLNGLQTKACCDSTCGVGVDCGEWYNIVQCVNPSCT